MYNNSRINKRIVSSAASWCPLPPRAGYIVLRHISAGWMESVIRVATSLLITECADGSDNRTPGNREYCPANRLLFCFNCSTIFAN